MFTVKTHDSPNGIVIAICDSDLIGKKIEEGNKQLDLTGSFYKGEEKTKEEIVRILKRAYVVNVVGDKSTKLLIDVGLVDPEHVKKIGGVSYAQAVIVLGD